MKIGTHYDPPPIPMRSFDWKAIDEDTYDGGEAEPMGLGATEAEAIADLLAQLEDRE